MADNASFDITCSCDMQEVDNAVNQANKELTQRYDFRNVSFEITLDRPNNKMVLKAPDSYKLAAIYEVLLAKLIKRGVAQQNIKAEGEEIAATGGTVRQEYTIKQNIDADTAKRIVKFVKDKKFKKVQASIQKDQVRVTSPSRDDLQATIAALKGEDFGLALTFGNFR